MNQMIAFCGIDCSKCDAFLATQNDDDQKRAEVAKLWSEQYNSNLKPEDINCDGCISESNNILNYCNICEIRRCGKEKAVLNCAYCDEYACEKLENFFKMVPDSKIKLDKIRSIRLSS